jgi:hypothetical protein
MDKLNLIALILNAVFFAVNVWLLIRHRRYRCRVSYVTRCNSEPAIVVSLGFLRSEQAPEYQRRMSSLLAGR